MTNKDKFIEVFGFEPDTETMIPVCPPRGVECPFMDDGIYSECHCELWWGREYKAPDNRKCEACKHRVMKVEVGKGTPPDHFWGCECCECEFEPTAKNDLGVREFEEIEVTYPPEEVCIYPEYKGKPYFAIKYKENGKEMVGYGTYNPEVLSQYLKGYFISTTKNDLGVDCVSRESVLELLNDYRDKHFENRKEYPVNYGTLLDVLRWIRNLPSVTPQEPTIKALGEELRKARESIADEKVLIGYNMAVAICNKHLGESEE